jgi:tripartite-type tricarboxylate transporter receptor subunit TctC
MSDRRCRFFALAFSVITAMSGVHASVAQAQAYPTKVIRVQVGYAAGGPTDNIARVFAGKMSTILGQQVIVENRPGAGGSIAAAAVAKSPADGYTLLMGEPGSMAVGVAQAQLPYDPRKDFTPIAQVASVSMVLAASPSLKIDTLPKLVGAATTATMSFGTPGNGTMQHLTMMHFGRDTGARFNHVAYRGGVPAMVDLIGGQIPLVMVTVPSVVQHVQSGAVVPLAVVAGKRSPQLPQVPTFVEAGYPSFAQEIWQGFFAPANLPRNVLTALEAAIFRAGSDPELIVALGATGAQVSLAGSAEFARTLQSDVAHWAKVVRENPGTR